MWRWIRKVVLYLLVFAVLVFGTGSLYQRIALHQDLKSFQTVGKLYDVSGHKMHMYTAGVGETTVVFASGWGTMSPYASYYPLYKGLSPHVKIAVYDQWQPIYPIRLRK